MPLNFLVFYVGVLKGIWSHTHSTRLFITPKSTAISLTVNLLCNLLEKRLATKHPLLFTSPLTT